ncbi:MAG: hypothetical protein L3K16_08485 [Thermoplasmata archaeon]|nr:hypothetical protein [Thermoplasmata archaeon]
MSRGRTVRSLPWLASVVAILALASLVPGPLGVPGARGTNAGYGSLSGSIAGPVNVGLSGNASYVVNATGGPAVAANGTEVGVYSYNASVAGTNTSTVLFSPSGGSMPNGTVTLSLKAGNVSQQLTLYVLVTSELNSTNATTNLSYTVNVVVPYRFVATVVAGAGGTVSPFDLTVLLDGAPVGQISVGTLASGTHYPVVFNYVDPNLSPGWHTFTVSLAEEHGLVTFAGGADSISQSFYVAGPAPNYELWYVAGFGLFVGVVFLYFTQVAATRRGRTKK